MTRSRFASSDESEFWLITADSDWVWANLFAYHPRGVGMRRPSKLPYPECTRELYILSVDGRLTTSHDMGCPPPQRELSARRVALCSHSALTPSLASTRRALSVRASSLSRSASRLLLVSSLSLVSHHTQRVVIAAWAVPVAASSSSPSALPISIDSSACTSANASVVADTRAAEVDQNSPRRLQGLLRHRC